MLFLIPYQRFQNTEGSFLPTRRLKQNSFSMKFHTLPWPYCQWLKYKFGAQKLWKKIWGPTVSWRGPSLPACTFNGCVQPENAHHQFLGPGNGVPPYFNCCLLWKRTFKDKWHVFCGRTPFLLPAQPVAWRRPFFIHHRTPERKGAALLSTLWHEHPVLSRKYSISVGTFVPHKIIFFFVLLMTNACFQCLDTVGWASGRGR